MSNPNPKRKRPNLIDAGRLVGGFVGLPTLKSSNYVPTISNNKQDVYYTYPNLKQNVLENMQYRGRMPWDVLLNMQSFDDLYNDINSKKDKEGRYSRTMSGAGLGGYSIGTGEDDNGKYISVYDRYDFGWLPFLKGKEIYDRIYKEDFDKYKPAREKNKYGGFVRRRLENHGQYS